MLVYNFTRVWVTSKGVAGMAGKVSSGTNHDGLDLDLLRNRDDPAEGRTVASRKRLRDRLASDVEQYLLHGGTVEVVETGANSQPLKKPQTNYGGRPI